MKKSWESLILAGILSLSLSVPAFAGSWQLDSTGYWYQNDDGTYPVSCWQWIDGQRCGTDKSCGGIFRFCAICPVTDAKTGEQQFGHIEFIGGGECFAHAGYIQRI